MAMTEQEWLACSDPQKMLEFLHGKASDRKLRLFAAACAWRRKQWPDESNYRALLAVVDQWAESSLENVALKEARNRAFGVGVYAPVLYQVFVPNWRVVELAET